MTNLQNGAIYQGYCLINQMLKADLRRECDRRENSNDYSCNNDHYHHKSIGSQYLAKYIRNGQQANEATAAQYEYRLSRFEKYIAMAYKEQQQQDQGVGEG
jgi:hypothetical protein